MPDDLTASTTSTDLVDLLVSWSRPPEHAPRLFVLASRLVEARNFTRARGIAPHSRRVHFVTTPDATRGHTLRQGDVVVDLVRLPDTASVAESVRHADLLAAWRVVEACSPSGWTRVRVTT